MTDFSGFDVFSEKAAVADADRVQLLDPELLYPDPENVRITPRREHGLLPGVLRASLIEAAKPGPDQPEVHIKPNKLVDYGRVAMVLAAAQRLGVTKMGIVGNEQFVK